jgi:hypothetical protein
MAQQRYKDPSVDAKSKAEENKSCLKKVASKKKAEKYFFHYQIFKKLLCRTDSLFQKPIQ